MSPYAWYELSPYAYGAPQGGPYAVAPHYPPYHGGLPTDEDITNMVYDALDNDPLIPFDYDINVNVDAGEVTLTGSIPTKRIKHAAGDDAWYGPGVTDVHNKLVIAKRERQVATTQARKKGKAA